MAELIGGVQFIGSLSNLSAYRMKGTDKVVVRKKGGPTKKQIKYSPQFENTRRNNREFGGRVKGAQQIKRGLYPLQAIADYNITGPLNALLKPIQEMDKSSGFGKRNVLLTKQPRLLEGFNLNNRYLLDSVIRTPVTYAIEPGEVTVTIPDLLPSLNFIAPDKYGWYQITALVSLLSDLYYSEHGYRPVIDQSPIPKFVHTDWLPVNNTAAAQQLVINNLPNPLPTGCSMMIAAGIAFGNMMGNDIRQAKYVGAAKVIGMV